MKKVLLIIDVQNDFVENGALACSGGKVLAQKIYNYYIENKNNYDYVFLSRDWHISPSDHFEKWPVHCVYNTNGAKFVSPVNKIKGYIVSKGQYNDGYSAFSNINSDFNTGSDAGANSDMSTSTHPELNSNPHPHTNSNTNLTTNSDSDMSTRKKKHTHLHPNTHPNTHPNSSINDEGLKKLKSLSKDIQIDICGIATDYCVKASALDAKKNFENVNLLLDLCIGVDKKTSNDAIKEMKLNGIRLTTVN